MKKTILDLKGNKDRPVFPLMLILSIEVVIAFIISITDKTDNILVHLMYLPVLLATLLFDYRIGILSAIIAELLTEIFSPVKMDLIDIQHFRTGFIRIAFLTMAVLIVNIIKKWIEDQNSQLDESNNIHPFTQLPYWDSFRDYSKMLINNRTIIHFRFFLIEINNQNELFASFGLDCIDKVNQEIIFRTRSKFRDSKLFLIRLDTFGLVIFNIRQDISELIELYEEPVVINGIPLYVEVSIGEASYPEGGYTADELLKNSFLALSEAKRYQIPYKQYNQKLQNPETSVQLGQFQIAMQNKEIDFHYQPIITSDGQVCALEALVRWNHPIKGLIPPDDFIPNLEFTRITNHLTYYSLNINLSRIQQLYNEGFDLSIALNISITNLLQPDFSEQVLKITQSHQFPAHHLCLEITERGFLSNDPVCKQNLRKLINNGVNVSIDDFGVGFTSISNFKYNNIHSIKIDKSFIRDIHIIEDNQAILKGLISIAKSANIVVIAEGIEKETEKEKVIEFGVDCLQGYLISHPLNFTSIRKWLIDRRQIDSKI